SPVGSDHARMSTDATMPVKVTMSSRRCRSKSARISIEHHDPRMPRHVELLPLLSPATTSALLYSPGDPDRLTHRRRGGHLLNERRKHLFRLPTQPTRVSSSVVAP